jgi:hypothetical protein
MNRRHKRPPTYSLLDEMLASSTEPLSQEKRTHQITRMHQGLASIARGTDPTTDDWRVCSDAVNLMETLVVEMQIADDSDDLLQDAIVALAAAGRRHKGGMPIWLDGAGLNAVRAILQDYEALLDELPARTMVGRTG